MPPSIQTTVDLKFFFWDMPTSFSHELWTNPYTHPYIHAQVNQANHAGFNPSGYSRPTTLGAAPAGWQMANWVSYYYEQTRLAYASVNKVFEYGIWPQNWGSYGTATADSAWGYDLMRNYRDKALTPDADSEIGRYAPFAQQGAALNQTWTTEFCESFRDKLAEYGAPSPKYFFFDQESNIGIDYSCRGDGQGWLEPVLEDPRYSTELIDGVSTFEEFLLSRATIDGGPVNYFMNSYMYSVPANYDFFNWISNLTIMVGDYAMWSGFFSKAKTIFPDVLVGNYNYYCSSTAYPHYDSKAYLSQWMVNTLLGDYQIPVLYPLSAVSFQDSQSTYLYQFARYQVSYTGNIQTDMARLYVARSKKVIDNCSLANEDIPLAPWVGTVDWEFDYTSLQYPGGGTYTIGAQEIIDIIKHGILRGVKIFHCFTPSITSVDADTWVEILDEAEAYYRALYLQDPGDPTDDGATVDDTAIDPENDEEVDPEIDPVPPTPPGAPPSPNLVPLYVQLARLCSNYQSNVEASTASLDTTIETILGLTYEKVDILYPFLEVRDEISSAQRSTRTLIDIVRSLNNHALNSTGYSNLDSFFFHEEITVPIEWKTLCDLAGRTFSTQFIEA